MMFISHTERSLRRRCSPWLAVAPLVVLLMVLLAVLLAPRVYAVDKLTVNFREADIRAVLESVAEITGRSFILDPRVQGKITIVAPEALASDMLYEVILSALQVHGYQAVDDGAVTRIVPFSQAFQVAGGAGGNEIETAVLRTSYSKASELVPSIKPMLSQGALIQAHDASNHLIVTDTRAQVARVRSIVAEMDNPQQGAVDIITLQHIAAAEALHIAAQLGQFRGDGLSIVEDVYNNRLIVSGNPVVRQDLKNLIRSLDQPQASGGGVAVVRLSHAQAEPLKALLEGLLESSMYRRQVLGEGTEASYKIQADTANNALVIAADAGVVADIRKVVRQLDVPQKQVLIEAIIAEISEEQAKVLSVQLAVAGREGGAIINFNDLLPALIGLGLDDDITGEDLARVPLGGGLTGGGATWDDDRKRGFGMLVQALKSDGNTNILSTPSVVTLDNSEATISVGQEVPFITGSYVSGSNAVDNPFQTIQREEVGIKLKVLPQITDGKVVRMSIEQETSNLLPTTVVTGTADVVTAKRVITTNVMVGDGEFLVLGGLIDEAYSGDQSKVPVLGNIPVLGHLFRSRGRSSSQSVLMVFIRPTILGDQARIQDVTEDRFRYLRQRQLNAREAVDGESAMPPLPERLEQIHRPAVEQP